MVVCRAENGAARQVCEDQLRSRLQAAGVTPILGPDHSGAPDGGAQVDAGLLDAARDAGAKAVFLTGIAADASVVTPGPSVGIGVGGYGGSGGWHGSSGVGAGVGVNVPVGAGQVETAYAADMVVTDVASGRILWTSKVTTGASRDLGGQIATMVETGVHAAQKAGLF